MNTDISDLQTITDTLTARLLGLSSAELARELSAAYKVALECSQADDSVLRAELGPPESERYAELKVSFQKALGRVDDIKSKCAGDIFFQKEVVPFMAKMMVRHQLLSAFRNPNGFQKTRPKC